MTDESAVAEADVLENRIGLGPIFNGHLFGDHYPSR
jgi:hypothetical protein